MRYDSRADTLWHIHLVRNNLATACEELSRRGCRHDLSKLDDPEKPAYDRIVPRLKEVPFGSDEYKEALTEMGEALRHHYRENSHHPESHPDGIDGMDLFDLIEMFCDWKAAAEDKGNDLLDTMDLQKKRFEINDQLYAILVNTLARWPRRGGRVA